MTPGYSQAEPCSPSCLASMIRAPPLVSPLPMQALCKHLVSSQPPGQDGGGVTDLKSQATWNAMNSRIRATGIFQVGICRSQLGGDAHAKHPREEVCARKELGEAHCLTKLPVSL
ncbi:hypothetical protein KIL84_005604 [Mauremys mutica]|uniref:Uncharacterized protein n=1 Tax=Mauremys mutica TaxID=74926 RepID=A0A9D3XFE1_9SAUR|nr:hypothetical protein KIL84_005604 [Mauremys mutica]